MTVYDRLAHEIETLRKKQGLKQKEVAEKVGISPSVYSRFERNGLKLSVDRIEHILNVLGYTLIPSKKKNYRDLRINEQDISNIDALLNRIDGEGEKEEGPWQTLKQMIRQVLEMTDEVVTDMQAEADASRQEMTPGEQRHHGYCNQNDS